MSIQSHIEAILKPYQSHIIIVGINMASIWLRYGFNMALKRIKWEYHLSFP